MQNKLILSFAVLLAFSLPALGQNAPDRPLITVTGQAEILAVPDEVVFSVNATTVDKDLLIAQRKTDEVVRNVLALARKYQIPATQVQTGYISLEERYSNEAATRQPRVFLGYAVSKSVAIILRDVSKAEALLAEIFRTGITRINSVDFRTTQSRKLKDQARLMAIKAAQEKASALAREIGQSIGKAYTIVEQAMDTRRYASNVAMDSFIGEGTLSEEPSPIALGQISITARVVVSFELK
jgi:uncharacterized protein YggE